MMWVQTDQLHSTSSLRKPDSESMNQLTLSETRYIPFIIGIQLTLKHSGNYMRTRDCKIV